MFRECTLMCEGILLCAFLAFLLLGLKLTPPDDELASCVIHTRRPRLLLFSSPGLRISALSASQFCTLNPQTLNLSRTLPTCSGLVLAYCLKNSDLKGHVQAAGDMGGFRLIHPWVQMLPPICCLGNLHKSLCLPKCVY